MADQITFPVGSQVNTGQGPTTVTGDNQAGLQAGANGGSSPSNNGQDVLNAITSKLLGQSGMVTSDTTGMDKLINDSIAGIQSANDKSQAGIKATYDQQKDAANLQGGMDLTKGQEGSQYLGAASSLAVVNQIKDHTDKVVKDLDQRETQALAAGQTDVATQIAGLKMQQIQFSQKATQDTFTNLLGVANAKIQQQQLQVQLQSSGRAQLDEYTKSGAIASLSDAQLQDLSTKTGLDMSGLEAIRARAKQSNITNITATPGDNGTLTFTGVDQNNKPVMLGQFAGIAKTKDVNPFAYFGGGNGSSGNNPFAASIYNGISKNASITGNSYIDGSNYSGQALADLSNYAATHGGAQVIDKTGGQAVDSLNTAFHNTTAIGAYIANILPPGSGDPRRMTNTLQSVLGTDAKIAGYKSFENSAIGIAKAMGESGRVPTQIIQQVKEGLPLLTDPLNVAYQKLSNIVVQLSNAESAITANPNSTKDSNGHAVGDVVQGSDGHVYRVNKAGNYETFLPWDK